MRTLIKGGTVITASDTFAADVWIENGKVAAQVAPGTQLGNADQTIDATGKYVIPGGIDCHTHMEMPFGGTKASSYGPREQGRYAVEFYTQAKTSYVHAGEAQ